MAHLPPKVPNISPNWPNFAHQVAPNTTAQPSWVDEFLDFSSAKRGSHRRAASDSVAFVECPILDECPAAPMTQEFDKLDDEQLMSMFTDDFSAVTVPGTVSTSNPSTPSDHNSINDDKSVPADQQLRNELDVQSPCNSDQQVAPSTVGADPVVIDPKRVKRILANRQSAQRSRVRKLQYISELERSVTSLQTEVSTLSPRVAFLDHQRLILNVDNSALKQRIAALAQDKIFKDAHQEALKKEVERLRHVYNQQSLKKNATPANVPQACTDNENFLAS